jgi:uncharacterized protein (DUF1800 family)
MATFTTRFRGRRRILALATMLGLSAALVSSAAADGTSKPEGLNGVSFLTKKTRLWLDRSQMICFRADQAPDNKRYFSFQADERYVHVLVPPVLMPGETLGYIRLRAVQEGETDFILDGNQIEVDIVKDTAAKTIDQTKPEIVTPSEGANVWGTFAVGVERFEPDASVRRLPPVLRLPNGEEVVSQFIPDQEPGPYSRFIYNVNAGDLQPGANALVAVEKNESEGEIVSQPLYVMALAGDPTEMSSGFCKDFINYIRIPFAPKPPVQLVNDDKYYHGMVAPGDGGFSFPVQAAEKAEYQLFVTARGDMGGNALPSISIRVDDVDRPVTMSRLATTKWQRIAVGNPIVLEPGLHVLKVRLQNGFYGTQEDRRTLFFEKYELGRVDKTSAPLLASNDGASMMMSGGSTMMMQAATNGSVMMAPGMQGGGINANAGNFGVVFRDALDGQFVTGRVTINALCWWPDREHSPPPRVQLMINKKIITEETSGQPQFRVEAGAFAAGANLVQLRAILSNGLTTSSPEEKVYLPDAIPSPPGPVVAGRRFTVFDAAWDKTMAARLQGGEPGTAAFYTNGDAVLNLPGDLQGDYKIFAGGRGADFQGPPLLTLLQEKDGHETKLGEVPVGPNMGEVFVAKTTFQPGVKQVTVRYANDAWAAGKGDRNLFVKWLRFEPVNDVKDIVAPVATITYSPANKTVGMADAVVAQVTDDRMVALTDLLLDGQPQHFDLRPPNGFGPILFPLLTRGLAPGAHKLAVLARDEAGNIGWSKEIHFNVAAPGQAADDTYARALLLLNRFGYGPEPGELAAVLAMGPHAWLASRLAETSGSAGEQNEQARLRVEFPDQRDGGQVVSRATQYLLTDPNPVRARFLMWAENHFSTWISKDGAPQKAQEHNRFLQLGPAPFADMLFASATSPAMLIYLDQRNSVANRLNENYAREIMELHTLGAKGGYTQQDVTTLADLLTGWTLADEAPLAGGSDLEQVFRYDPYLSSNDASTIFGLDFPGLEPAQRFDRVQMALEMLAANPSCAQFISRRLVEHYVSDPAPPALVDDLAQVYLETGGDLREMLLAMADDPAFWSAPLKIASPIDFSVRSARLAHMPNPGMINDFIAHCGMGMFDRATPDGYPEADGFSSSSNALLQRWRFATEVQNGFMASGIIPNAWRPPNTGWNPDNLQRLTDLVAVRMTGNVLSSSSNEATLTLLATASADTEDRLHVLTTFVGQLPEVSLR